MPDTELLDSLEARIPALRDTEPDGWENCGNCRQGIALEELAEIATTLIAQARKDAEEIAALREVVDPFAAQREKDLRWFMGQDAYYHYAPEQPDLVANDALLTAYRAAIANHKEAATDAD